MAEIRESPLSPSGSLRGIGSPLDGGGVPTVAAAFLRSYLSYVCYLGQIINILQVPLNGHLNMKFIVIATADMPLPPASC